MHSTFIIPLCLVVFVAKIYAIPSSVDHLRPRASVTDCLKSSSVPYAVKGSTNWTALSSPYNLRLVYQPAVITIPESQDQVSSSITCAAAAGLKVQAKGGGHSYASFSSGGQDGSLIVDMQKFSSITVDQGTFIAKIGAGQRLGNVALALYAQGKRALPHGTCSGVGIAGHALHGGYGYASRKWGLTLDHVVGLDVVLANGTQIHTTSTAFPDIFYAMRGAGDSFGIATYFYFATEAAPATVLSFGADLGSNLKNLNVMTSAFVALQNFTLTSPSITSDIAFGFYIDSDGTVSLQGWCINCATATLSNVILPGLLSGFRNPKPTVKSLNWIDALTSVGNPLQQPLGSAYSEHDTFYAKSVTTRNSIPLTAAAFKAYWSYIIAHQGQGPFFSIINLYGGPGSAINIPSTNSSAYADRDALWTIQNYGYTSNNQPPYDAAITGLVDGLETALTNAQPTGKFAAYLNYVDPALTATQAAQVYYGATTYDRLLSIKTQVDPGFVFWNPQSIGNSMAL